jgi:hypothetical protein
MINHNADSTNTYKQGISAFADVTEEEFFSYYNIVGGQQECSATYHSSEA